MSSLLKEHQTFLLLSIPVLQFPIFKFKRNFINSRTHTINFVYSDLVPYLPHHPTSSYCPLTLCFLFVHSKLHSSHNISELGDREIISYWSVSDLYFLLILHWAKWRPPLYMALDHDMPRFLWMSFLFLISVSLSHCLGMPNKDCFSSAEMFCFLHQEWRVHRFQFNSLCSSLNIMTPLFSRLSETGWLLWICLQLFWCFFLRFGCAA